MRSAVLPSLLTMSLQAAPSAPLTADMVDFSGAYADFSVVFGTVAVLSVMLLSARSVFNFLGR